MSFFKKKMKCGLCSAKIIHTSNTQIEETVAIITFEADGKPQEMMICDNCADILDKISEEMIKEKPHDT